MHVLAPDVIPPQSDVYSTMVSLPNEHVELRVAKQRPSVLFEEIDETEEIDEEDEETLKEQDLLDGDIEDIEEEPTEE